MKASEASRWGVNKKRMFFVFTPPRGLQRGEAFMKVSGGGGKKQNKHVFVVSPPKAFKEERPS